jgi:hypothetical protein
LEGIYQGKTVALTNAHLFDKRGEEVVQLTSRKQGEAAVATPIGRVLELDEATDSALVELNPGVHFEEDTIRNIGKVSRYPGAPQVGELVVGYGARSHGVRAAVTEVDAAQVQGGGRKDDIVLRNIDLTRPVSLTRDSGTAWVDNEGRIVGQHHARFPPEFAERPPGESRSLSMQMTRLCGLYDGFCPSDWEQAVRIQEAQKKAGLQPLPKVAQRDIDSPPFVILGRPRPTVVLSEQVRFVIQRERPPK